jgi:hypothetical protein
MSHQIVYTLLCVKKKKKRTNGHADVLIQLFITYVSSQQLQGQLQTQDSVDTSNYIMDKHNLKWKTNYRRALEEKHINAENNNNNFINTKLSCYWELRNVKHKHLERIIIIKFSSILVYVAQT